MKSEKEKEFKVIKRQASKYLKNISINRAIYLILFLMNKLRY